MQVLVFLTNGNVVLLKLLEEEDNLIERGRVRHGHDGIGSLVKLLRLGAGWEQELGIECRSGFLRRCIEVQNLC